MLAVALVPDVRASMSYSPSGTTAQSGRALWAVFGIVMLVHALRWLIARTGAAGSPA